MSEEQKTPSQIALGQMAAHFGALAQRMENSPHAYVRDGALVFFSIAAAFEILASTAVPDPNYSDAFGLTIGVLVGAAAGTFLTAEAGLAMAAILVPAAAPEIIVALVAAALVSATLWAVGELGKDIYYGTLRIFEYIRDSVDNFTHSDFMKDIESFFGISKQDPLAFDLDKNGISLISLENSNVSFDIDGNGFSTHTAWIGSNDAFLILDRNGDGVVNDITEFFGGSDIGGFAALAQSDENNDGKIDKDDTIFTDLLLWVDSNSDGFTDDGELISLSQYGIIEINLYSTIIDKSIDGSTIYSLGNFVKNDGSTGQIAEIYFANNSALTHFQGVFEFDSEICRLPNARGYGTVPDLWISMSLDSTLRTMVQAFSELGVADHAAMQAAILPILYRWAGVEDVGAGSRGAYVDARHLAIVENFVGQDYNFRGYEDPQFSHQGSLLERAFDTLLETVGARLMLSGPLQPYFDEIGFDFAADAFILPAGFAGLPALLANDAPADFEAAADYWAEWAAARSLLESMTEAVGRSRASLWGDFKTAFESQHLPFTFDQMLYGRYFFGSTGDDVLTGTWSADFLHGGTGDDLASGGAGGDTYYFARGDGNDRIDDQGDADGQDTLRLAGIAPGMLRVIEHADKLILLVDGGNDGRVDILDAFSDQGGIETVVFDDGTTWSKTDLLARAEPSDGTVVTHLGTVGNDSITGSAIGDLIDGRRGDDTLAGGAGDDIYLYARNNGDDTIIEEIESGKADELHLRGIDPAAVTFSADDNDIIVTVAESTAGAGDGGTITLKDGFMSGGYAGIEAIVFDDGTRLRPTGIDVWLERGQMDARVAVSLVIANLVESIATAPETVTPASVEVVEVLVPAVLQFLTDDLGPFLTTVFEDGVVPLFTGDFEALGPGLVAVLHDLGLVVEGTAEIVLPAVAESVRALLPALSDFLLTDAIPAISQKLIVEGLIPALVGDYDNLEALLGDTFEFAVPALTGAVDTLVGPVTEVLVDDVVPLVGDVLTDTVAPLLTGEAAEDPGGWLSGTLAGLLGNLGQVVAGVGAEIVPAVGTVLDNLLPATADFVGDALPIIGDIIADDVVPALTMGAEEPQAVVDDVFEFTVPVVSDVVGGAVSVTTDLLVDDVLPIVSDIIVDGVAPLLSGQVDGLLPTLGSAVGGLLSSVADVVTDDLPGLFAWGRTSTLKNRFFASHGDDFSIL